MAESAEPQSYANHRRYDPSYHGFVFGVLLITLLLAIYNVIRTRQAFALWFVILSIAWIVLALKVRLYSLKAQDRVIRLEERLRLQSLLPESLRPRIPELNEAQLIALRFASDGELASLVTKVLDGKLSPDQIKQQITSWRADDFRV